ncbi:MHS family MFS transporter [Saccharopolyspora erythraea]|uniref:MFS transporter n=1 Tax=Saccharopolyspora erythraea TaxID=1836 RepID=UPI001BA9DF11|nr:MFS transporter [Saccharopolyspora erythraea]QUH04039.1 MHS family MFS transporter [Saccharopolyspora erythraea]
MTTVVTRDKPRVTDSEARRIAFAAFVGTALEWYDYFLFGTAASIVFNRLYFVSGDPLVAMLAAFASFAVGFLARPVGAVIFGHVGDRYGRRTSLIVTVTMIGVVTSLIGLLPDFAAIGVAAPVLLTCLRVLQGVAVGGEWGGAVTLAVEHAPPERRGRYAALPQVGSPVGTLLSSGAFALVSLLPPESFDSWGWRLPFLAAIPLLFVALYLRRRVEESPLFGELLEQQERSSLPVVEVMRKSFGRVLVGMCASLLGVGGFYLLTTFAISYGTETLGLPRSLMLGATLVAAAVEVAILLAFGRLAERLGSGRVCVLGSIASALAALPVFWLIDTRNPALVVVAITVGVACLSVPYAVSGSLLTELFPPHLRYSGVSIAFNLGGVVSGFVPLIATSVLAASGERSWSVALLLVGLAVLTGLGGALGARLRIKDEVSVR